MAYKLKTYIHFIQHQAEQMQTVIQDKFKQYLKPKNEVFRFYKTKGLSSPFVMMEFIGFIEKYFPQVIGEYLSFEDYITSEEG